MLDKGWCLKGLRSSELRAYWAVFVSIETKKTRKHLGSARGFLFGGQVKRSSGISGLSWCRSSVLHWSSVVKDREGLASTAEMTSKCCTPSSGKYCQLIEISEPSSDHLLLIIKTLMKRWLRCLLPKALKASSCSSLNQDCLTSV